MTWWLIFPAALLIISMRYGNLRRDPREFGKGKTTQQVAIGFIGMWIALMAAIVISVRYGQ